MVPGGRWGGTGTVTGAGRAMLLCLTITATTASGPAWAAVQRHVQPRDSEDHRACNAASLHAALFKGVGAMGTSAIEISVENLGTRACTLRGYSIPRMWDRKRLIPIRVRDTEEPMGSSRRLPLAPVLMVHRREGYLLISYNGAGVGTGCSLVTSLEIRLPGDKTWIEIWKDGHAPICEWTVDVSPIVAKRPLRL